MLADAVAVALAVALADAVLGADAHSLLSGLADGESVRPELRVFVAAWRDALVRADADTERLTRADTDADADDENEMLVSGDAEMLSVTEWQDVGSAVPGSTLALRTPERDVDAVALEVAVAVIESDT